MKLIPAIFNNIKKRHTAIIGMTRSGKTYFAKHVIKDLQAEGFHTLFVDPKREIDEEMGTVCTTPMQVYSQLIAKNPAIVFHPTAGSQERAEELTKVVDIVFKLVDKDGFKRIKRIVAIDEIQTFVRKGIHDGIDQLWLVGAGKGIMGMALTQRLQNMNETVWSQSENKIIFKIDDRGEYLRTRNLDHYNQQLDFFRSPENQFWFYATNGSGKWRRHKPIGAGTLKPPKRLRLSR